MPRPTAAQLAYGSATVVVSTIAMLLLSRTSSGLWIAFIAAAALALGLLVAVTVPLPRRRGRHAARPGSAAAAAPAPASAAAHLPYGDAPTAARVAEPRTAAAEHPVHH
ncbi:hypothetical protein [Streptomyces subrutilus]|uniref:Uncharacterized protein n=1 Tax=Streptomyces subrutilus TaxID=36818 RepID=A0A1E5PRI3_9ACTN|nr:hypothetical protein [Streptomyces subrutilus]OEJ32164.1 hypothetical protein BGK67_13185 [Streptomyces subrutilus]